MVEFYSPGYMYNIYAHTYAINWFWSTDSCLDTRDFLGSGSTLKELKAMFASAVDGNGAVNTLQP